MSPTTVAADQQEVTFEVPKLAEALLAHIRKKPGSIATWKTLRQKLGADQPALTQAAAVLADWDYRIAIRKNAGITFFSAPDLLNDIELSHQLNTREVGTHLVCYRITRSTNDRASELAETGAPHGTVVTAEEQTAGRGRLGRSWFSPAGTGIYLSILLRPAISPERAPGLSVMTALALARTLEPYAPGEVAIKWPNDLLLAGKKVAGILTELSAERGKISHLIVGVGVNVNHGVGNFPEDLRSSATSLRRVLKRKLSRVAIAQQFLRQFEKSYQRYVKVDLSADRRALKQYSSLMGKEVTLLSGEIRQHGLAVDIDSSGCLVLQQEDGRIHVAAGEVTVAKH